MADNERLITKVVGESRLTFDPVGSKITELVLDGHLISGNVQRWDREAAWHPCAPNTDSDPLGILPRHGVLRNATAIVLDLRPSDPETAIRTRTVLAADGYPEVEVLRVLTLNPRSLNVDNWYLNFSHEQAPVNHGEHMYFHAPNGWEGTTLNNMPLDEQIRGDKIFYWNPVNGLKIPGQPLILINQREMPFVNSWTGRNNEGTYDSHYFSLTASEGIPSTHFRSPESFIPPHVADPRKKSLTISVVTR